MDNPRYLVKLTLGTPVPQEVWINATLVLSVVGISVENMKIMDPDRVEKWGECYPDARSEVSVVGQVNKAHMVRESPQEVIALIDAVNERLWE